MKNNTIILFGLSGSGKSTLANMLGRKLGLRVVHPSSILKDLLEHKKPNIMGSKEGVGFWESSKGIVLFKNRLKTDQPIDLVCDKILLNEVKKGRLVMDSWSIPWLTKKGIKIYLKATAGTRAKRVASRSKVSIKTATKVVRLKDGKTRELYLKHRGFDIKKDHQVFDLVINTNRLSKMEVLNLILKSFQL